MKKVLLTGGFGFLGAHLFQYLKTLGYEVTILESSKAKNYRIEEKELEEVSIYAYDKDSLDVIFREPFDILINTATDYGRDTPNDELIFNNILYPIRLMNKFKASGGSIFINTDSYFNKKQNKCTSYLGPYILCKKQLEDWLKQEKKIAVVNMKLEHIYGPKDSPTKFTSQIISSLIKHQDLDLTAGEQKRDFIYVKDVCKMYQLAIQKIDKLGRGYSLIEVGTGQVYSIKQFVLLAKDVFKSSSNLNFGVLKMRENEIMFSSSTKNILSEGFDFTSLKDGLIEICSLDESHE